MKLTYNFWEEIGGRSKTCSSAAMDVVVFVFLREMGAPISMKLLSIVPYVCETVVLAHLQFWA